MKNNVRSPRSGCPVPPVSPFPKSSLSQRPRTRISGRGGYLFPPHRTPRMVRGRLHQRQKSRDSSIYQRPFSGAPRCVLNTPLGEKKNLPSRPRLKRVGEMDIGVFTSRCHDGGRWRGGSGQGEDRDPSALTPSRGWSVSDGRCWRSRSWAQLGQQQLSRSGFSTLDSARVAAL